MEILKIPQGEFQLSRYPNHKKELLRAWDAADEYLLNYFYEDNQSKTLNILIVNDSFGALVTALAHYTITSWTDSWLSYEGFKYNLTHNNLPLDSINIKNSIETPEGDYDYILIKIPKSQAFLEDQLSRIKPLISGNTKIIAAGMVKSIHNSTLKLFEKYIGTTKTSLAKKKARLILCSPDESIPVLKSPYPKNYILEDTQYSIVNHANVFSRENLDIGTRFFLQHIPQSEKYKKIIDLGCGNGIVGLMATEKNLDAELLFVDESYMAVESAKETFKVAFGDSSKEKRKAEFRVNDCLTGIKENSADLILNNPPFHQYNAIGDEIAWRMFRQSRDVLKPKGELWVIGNRHLGYHVKLKKVFSNCKMVASNKKFVILKSVKI